MIDQAENVPDPMPAGLRREILEMGALGQFDELDLAETGRSTLSYFIEAICAELLVRGATADEVTAPAMKVLGSMVGGLFGTGHEHGPVDEDDAEAVELAEMLQGVHDVGWRLREHLRHTIGLPRAPGRTCCAWVDRAEAKRKNEASTTD
ncbi:MAG: hypothetical protein JWN99_387 [Ilumatobacteraceae bacterium]|nr:hypothetical protein [Ilumatobacteraceae bacterium]